MRSINRLSYQAFIAAALCLISQSFSEPYIAVRSGFKCSVCHVNGTGGGKRTDFGEVYTQYKLLMQSPMTENHPYSFDQKLNKSISVGANFRIEQSYAPKLSSKAANLGDTIKTAESIWNPGGFKERNLYIDVDLVKDWLKLYYDKDMGGGFARELWAKVNLPANSYFKFGHMLLPYGYRLMDDEAFVRSTTGYTYSVSTLAYEVGIEPGPLSLVTNLTATSITSVGSLVFNHMPFIRTARLGGSISRRLKTKEKDHYGSYGVFAGTAFGMFTFLGERDYTKDYDVSKKVETNKVEDYMEMDFLPIRGWNIKTVYESLWPDKKIDQGSNNQTRLTVGLEPFVTQFLQLGLYYRMNAWIPQNPEKNQDQIVGRLHVFF